MFSPSAERNKGPIAEVLREVLPRTGRVLEIASGTGQHVAHFAALFPALEWQPSDVELRGLGDLPPNVLPPIELDVRKWPWPVQRADAIVCINMIHISPWAACEALMQGAAALLPPGAVLYLYGPFRRKGIPTAPSNEAFDASLRAQDAEWGLRDLEVVIEAAARRGLRHERTIEMPANNLSVIFRAA